MFYEILEDGTVGRSTNDEKIAELNNLTLVTDKEIIYGIDGKRYFKGEEPIPSEPNYIEKRQREYPSISDQLDMIYWDKVNGTDLWKEKIAEIKAKYPKE